MEYFLHALHGAKHITAIISIVTLKLGERCYNLLRSVEETQTLGHQ